MSIDLGKTLQLAHQALEEAKIPHVLIGGFALSAYLQHRATVDIDLLVLGDDADLIKKLIISKGFKLHFESENVLQFIGVGFLDILLAKRPLSKKMLLDSNLKIGNIPVAQAEDIIGLKIQAYKNDGSRELRDKADIFDLMKSNSNLNIIKIKEYAELFNDWLAIEELWKKSQIK